jgi:uncharacterized protein (UPF0332 family)
MNESALDYIQQTIDKSQRTIKVARLLFENDCFDDAVSRCYYAGFHAISAVLFSKGLTFSKHTQVLGAFNKEFVHSGEFPRSISQFIDQLFKDRMIGDYDSMTTIDRTTAQRDIEQAAQIVNIIKEYLRVQGFLKPTED